MLYFLQQVLNGVHAGALYALLAFGYALTNGVVHRTNLAYGAIFAFATSLDEVVLILFVAGPNQRTLARQMFSSIRENINPTVAAAALLLIVGTLCLGGLGALMRWQQGRKTSSAAA